MEVYLSVYFINHLGQKKKIDDKIVSIQEGIFDIENHKIYNSLTFIVNDLYIAPTIIGDLIERIEIKYKVNDEDEVTEKFTIDNVDYLKDNNIKIYCKSKTIKYTYKYTGNLNKTIQTNSVKDLISKLLPDVSVNYENLTDIPLLFDYEIKDKAIEEAIEDLSKITGFDYYFYRGVLYFEDKKRIKEDDVAIKKFSELSDIIEFSTSTNKDKKKINKLFINCTDTKDLVAEPTIALDINPSPQCCSPDEVLIFTDDAGNTYKINPINAFFIIYYSPTIQKPNCNIACKEGERILIEKFELNNDEYVELTGGIEEIIALEGVENYVFEKGYNLLAFDKVEKGELKITYKTKVLYGTIKHSKYPKSVNFHISHFNQVINYEHKIELNGYYPIPYKFTLNLMKDWGIDYGDAINKSITISRKDGDVFAVIGTYESNAFGELEFDINEYNTYKFEMKEQEPLYLDWYINKKQIYMDEVQ